MSAVLAKVGAQVLGVQIETAQLMEDLIGDLTAVPQPIEIKLFGDDTGGADRDGQRSHGRLSKMDGVVEIKAGVALASDALKLRIDPDRDRARGLYA